MYGAELANVYETLYRGRGKDWGAEAAYLARLIRDRLPAARSLLDVACGTGAHLEKLGELFGHTEGLDYSADMLAVAERRLPGGTFLHRGDMREFDLGRRFDAVSCMFTSISYTGGLGDMRAAVRRMAEHLVPGGVLVIEPWWFPEKFIPGYVAGEVVRENDRTIARVSHSTVRDNVTRLEVRYLVGTSAGITQFTEVDHLSLFTKDEYLAAFTDAGCAAEYIEPDPEGKDVIIPRGRGLFIGTRNGVRSDIRR
ncbi:SAM-dependent methyltransferase [Prauserella marina]|uniref:dTDP-3-amino-3,6-dideoxy-alpha-D-glucopyranose N,N-dimethyltransferase/N-dimethyltransferase n=1 Tax=Prauserella marina TaxID=530584 RepID=A0A222VLV1_9PSEU|nr:class I SAM-dependent methyltransferase [Prauserella marina]ASR34885.1 SAM-dependent methyltransferase [Prauserella marina]PWV85413.1 dTDP-3-amino-3,6-dideoxy-alpha-D-glucopyranose N,N-dimethyltransferase/N-dimethyltransferase [Prauserella marina]SDC55423.1 dTDP-3-amino-3,6-dideoxy-alpha-D-glucopyranose N,N-dimethyltransferase/N-dimethyltransferase [Prauserella marina]